MEKYVILIPCVVESSVGGLIPRSRVLFERDPASKHQAVHKLDKEHPALKNKKIYIKKKGQF